MKHWKQEATGVINVEIGVNMVFHPVISIWENKTGY